MIGQRVVDEQGVTYQLSRALGQGGQGAVYQVEGGRVAVKIASLPTSEHRRQLVLQLARLKRLPLEGLPLARPLALLRTPWVGYVMERLTGMIPLQRLLLEGDAPLQHFLETGGLRRRLRLLVALGEVLDALHQRGLAYGDLSPQNVFVSEAPAHHELKLIDLDNLSPVGSVPGRAFFTPFYGAPELVRGEGSSSTLTDAYSFAVMAFELLTGVHPLLGDAVVDGEPELEAQALEGRLPWIDHPTERWNETSRGLPRALVLSPGLQALAERTFNAGLIAPALRPTVRDWVERLQAALDAALTCDRCKATFYLREPLCPFCDAPRPALILAEADHWSVSARQGRTLEIPAEAHPTPWRRPMTPRKVLELGVKTPLSAAFLGLPEDSPHWVELCFEDNCLKLRICPSGLHPDRGGSDRGASEETRSSPGRDFWLISSEGQLEPLRTGFRSVRLPSSAGDIGWTLHAGHPQPDQAPGWDGHRRVRFRLIGGG